MNQFQLELVHTTPPPPPPQFSFLAKTKILDKTLVAYVPKLVNRKVWWSK